MHRPRMCEGCHARTLVTTVDSLRNHVVVRAAVPPSHACGAVWCTCMYHIVSWCVICMSSADQQPGGHQRTQVLAGRSVTWCHPTPASLHPAYSLCAAEASADGRAVPWHCSCNKQCALLRFVCLLFACVHCAPCALQLQLHCGRRLLC
jgi:hypothetical protein